MTDEIIQNDQSHDAVVTRLGELEDVMTTLKVKFPDLLISQVAMLQQPCKTEFTTSGNTGSAGMGNNALKVAEENARKLAKLVCATNGNCSTPKVQRVVDVTPGRRTNIVKFAWTCE